MFTQYSWHASLSLRKLSMVLAHRGLLMNKTETAVTKKMIYRNFRVCRKASVFIVRHNYCRKKVFSNFISNNEIYLGDLRGSSLFCNHVCCKLYSSMKDDEIIKSWLNEIKDDFDKEQKAVGSLKDDSIRAESSISNIGGNDKNSPDVENVSLTDDENLHTFENDFDKLEKLGFTTEEIIELLKRATSLEENEVECDHSDSEKEDDAELTKSTNEELHSGDNTSNAEKQDGKSESGTSKMELEEWAVVKMKPDVKTDWSVVEIEDFVNIAEAESDTEETWEPPVDLVRGRTGVYDIEELVEVLRVANAQDLITIRIPPELNFADYMVIASAKSPRHLQAITNDVKWIHKRKKSKSDRFLKIEGEKSEWCAIDLGNIVLHIFMPDMRKLYDLETLWTVGARFDPQCAEPVEDPYVFSVDDLPWLKELEQTSDQSVGQEETSGSNYKAVK